MKTEILKVPQKMSFKKILRLHKFKGFIPSNKIIDKRVPGIGATSREIICRRNSIILEPFVAIIEVKKIRYGDALCVIYGDITVEKAVSKVTSYLIDNTIQFKKIMTTPESFYKVRLALELFSTTYNKEFFFLIDECDVLVDDAIFRDKMLEVMPDFFSFVNKAMISATPELPSDPRFEMHKFEHLVLEPKYKFKKKLNLIVTNNINATIREVINTLNKKDDQPIFFFTNCKRTICYLARLEVISKDYKVFCNKNLDEKFFKPHGLCNVSDTVVEQKYAKYNFFTSRFFAGVDFLLKGGILPHIIMCSNIIETPHSIINPKVNAVQIFGRCRNGISSITHITNLHADGGGLDEQEIRSGIEDEIYYIEKLRQINSKSYNNQVRKVLNDVIDKTHTNVIYQNGIINPYFKDNYLSLKLTDNLYHDINRLLERYKNGKFFIVKQHKVYKRLTDEDLLHLKKITDKRKASEFLSHLHEFVSDYGIFTISNSFQEFWHKLSLLAKEDKLIYNAYFAIGYEEIIKLKFSRPMLRNAVFENRKADKQNHMRMIDEILLTFPLNLPIYIDAITTKLQSIYLMFSFEKKAGIPAKAIATDIEEYFNFKRINGKKKIDGFYKTFYILTSPKFKLSYESQLLR